MRSCGSHEKTSGIFRLITGHLNGQGFYLAPGTNLPQLLMEDTASRRFGALIIVGERVFPFLLSEQMPHFRLIKLLEAEQHRSQRDATHARDDEIPARAARGLAAVMLAQHPESGKQHK